jgi:hypothetical protein
MKTIKVSAFALAFGLAAAGQAQASYCIAVNGGFGKGGTSFVSRPFTLPAANTCKPWSGLTKTATSVIATSTGTGCLSSNGKVLTLSVISTNPGWFGPGQSGVDHIQLCPTGTTNCPISGSDAGSFGPGTAVQQTCTSSLLNLPAVHN